MAGTAKEKLFELISDMNGSSEDEVPSTIGMEYGGGLDDAYMTLSQRRNSAFADPNANSAFASPMSMGGLPTIYRANGGGYEADDYGDYSQADLDEAMADNNSGAESAEQDAGAGNTNFDDTFYYVDPPQESTITPTAPTSDGGADLPDYAYGITDDRRQDLFGPEGRENPEGALSSGARSVLLTTLREMKGNWPDAKEAFKNMTTPEMMNFQKAYEGPWSFDGSTGYRFGGPEGTLQDILEKRVTDQFGLGDIISKDKEERKKDKENKDFRAGYLGEEVSESFMDKIGLGGLYDTLTDMFSIQSEVSPTTLEGITKQLEGTGAQFTPVNSFLAGAMDFALPLAAKGLANLTGGGKTIGTITTADGLSFNLSDKGKLSMNTSTPEYDEGGGDGESKDSKKKKLPKKTEEEKKKKSYMKDYFASLGSKEGEGGLSNLKNYYETQALKYVYPDKSDEEINIMINKP